jgi:hypothetical protein
MTSTIISSPHLLSETLVPVAEACEEFPVRNSRQTLERWMRGGCRGVILESVTIGFRRFTSKEAIAVFCPLKPERRTKKANEHSHDLYAVWSGRRVVHGATLTG